jgi:hypothetical protein
MHDRSACTVQHRNMLILFGQSATLAFNLILTSTVKNKHIVPHRRVYSSLCAKNVFGERKQLSKPFALEENHINHHTAVHLRN